jgi:hypothetical protein
MVKNLCERWGYTIGTPLGKGGIGLLEPIQIKENARRRGLGYTGPNHIKRSPKKGLIRFISAGFVNPNHNLPDIGLGQHDYQEKGKGVMEIRPEKGTFPEDEFALIRLFEEGLSMRPREVSPAPEVCVVEEKRGTFIDPVGYISTEASAANSRWYFASARKATFSKSPQGEEEGQIAQ